MNGEGAAREARHATVVTAGSLERFVMPVSLTEGAGGPRGFRASVRLRRFGRRGPSKTVRGVGKPPRAFVLWQRPEAKPRAVRYREEMPARREASGRD